MRCQRPAVAAIAVALTLSVVTACTDEGEPGRSPSATPETTAATAAPTASASPSPLDTGTRTPSTSASEGPVDDAGFDLTDKAAGGFPDLGDDVGPGAGVRVGRHEGYDRVVFDFAGSGTPTYLVRYVDTPVADGSGDPVAVGGVGYLEVLVTTVSIPGDGQGPPSDPGAAELDGTVIAEANAIFGGFEGYGQTFIGVLERERPFRVTLLADPVRLVVDIQR